MCLGPTLKANKPYTTRNWLITHPNQRNIRLFDILWPNYGLNNFPICEDWVQTGKDWVQTSEDWVQTDEDWVQIGED